MNHSCYLDPRVAASYDAEHRQQRITVDDVPFYVRLAQEAAADGQAVLELACGTGRVTLPIAEAGARVTGLDASPAMLDMARAKSAGSDNPRWVEADMTSFGLGERFGLVVIPFRSFLHLLTVEDQRACLGRVNEHLIDGGRLALNFFNPEVVASATQMTTNRSAGEHSRSRLHLEGQADRRYSRSEPAPANPLKNETLSDSGAIISRVSRNLRIRYLHRFEMEELLSLCGFEVEALYGWFDRRPFGEDSQEMVWIARKRRMDAAGQT